MASLIGQTVSHYRILEHLGGGGMGVVYRAEDTRLKRIVALKFLPPESTRDPMAKERFMIEAQAASALQHNNICTIHDIDDTSDGQMFIVMDCYDGETLEDKLRRQSMSLADISDVSGQVASGMIVAHERGIIHRDLKPSNIFVTRAGVVKILDFGLAKLLGSSRITREGRVPGTVPYMSPEQVSGNEVDSGTDIWAFGVILFQLLTGYLPFAADHDQAVIYRILCEPAPPLLSLRSDIPQNIVAVVEKCLEKDRARRLQSMAEVLDLLEDRSVKRIPPSPNWWRRRATSPLPVSGLIITCLALVFYFTYDLLFAPNPKRDVLKLAVLLFANQTNESDIDIYRPGIQNRLVSGLTHAAGVSIEDGLRINDIIHERFESDNPRRTDALYAFLHASGYDYVVDGTISKSSQVAYSVQVTCKSTLEYETHHETFTKPPLPKELLTDACESLSEEILAYLQVEVLDVKPEMGVWEPSHRYKNWAAIAQLSGAYEAFLRGNTDGATIHLENAIGLDSAFISPRIWWGPSIRHDKAKVENNLKALARLRNFADDFERAMIDWVTAFHRDRPEDEIQYLNEALQYDSNNRIVLSNLAGAYLKTGDTTEALSVYDRLMKSRWEFPGMYRAAVKCLLAQRKYHGAEEALTLWRAVDTSAISALLFGWLSAVSSRHGDSAHEQELRLKFRALCKRNGVDSVRTEYILGGCYADFGLLEQSERFLRTAVSGDVGNPDYHERLGDVLIAKGDTASGFEEYQGALQLKLSSNKLHSKLGALLEKKGDAKGARDHYRKFVSKDSTSVEGRRLREWLKRYHL